MSLAVSSSKQIPTYYGRPAIKPSLYGWTVGLYIFVGGLAGAAQILATAADLLGVPDASGVILGGRVLALAGAIIGAVLLIVELHTKERFANMLRIFRPTSPMSIGSYVLVSFGFWSLAALIVELIGIHPLALAFGILAAISGWFMTSYTAAFLAATSTPLWASAPRSLSVRFAASAFATGAAALCLIALALDEGVSQPLSYVAIAALAIDLLASIAAELIYGRAGLTGLLREHPWGLLHLAGVQVAGLALPIALFVFGNLSNNGYGLYLLIGSLCTLAGGILMRGTVLLAGNRSAERPIDYFRFATAARSERPRR